MIVLEAEPRRDYGPSYPVSELPEAMRREPGLIVRIDRKGHKIAPRSQFGGLIDTDGNPVFDPRLSSLVALIKKCKLPEEVVDALLFDTNDRPMPVVEELVTPASLDPELKNDVAYKIGWLAHAMAYQAGLISMSEFFRIADKLDAFKPEQ